MASIRQLYVSLTLRAESYNNALRQAQKETREFERLIKPTVKTAQSLGTALTATVTAPIAAMGALALKAGTDFETAFAGVRKTVTASEAEFQKLNQEFRNMSREIPLSASELANIGEAAGQLGIRTENIAKFSRTMAQLGTATNLSATEAATALARFANITQLPQEKIENLGSAIVALGNNMATTEADIVQFSLRIAGAGKQVGLTEAEIAGFGAALSSVGIEAEAGGTAISKVFIKLANAAAVGGDELTGFARIAGETSAQFKRHFETDAAGATVAFISGLKRISTEGGNVFAVLDELGLSEIRVRDALLRASGAGDLLATSLGIATKAFEENTALTREAEERYKTTASQLQILKNELMLVGIELFDALGPILKDTVLPVLKTAADFVIGLAHGFAELDPWLQKLIVAGAAVAAAIGPLLVIFAQLAPAISIVVGWVSAAGGLTAALAGLGAILTGPVGIVAAIAAAVAALGYFALQNEEVRAAVAEAWASIQPAISEVLAVISDVLRDAVMGWRLIWAEYGDDIKAFVGLFVKPMIAELVNAIKTAAGLIKAALEVIAGVIKAFHGLVTGDWTKFAEGIKKIWQGLWDAIKTIMGAPIEFVQKKVEGFASTITNAFKDVYDKVVGNSYVPDLVAGIKTEFGKLVDVMVHPTQLATGLVTGAFDNMFSSVIGKFTRNIPLIGGALNRVLTGIGGRAIGGVFGTGAAASSGAGAAASSSAGLGNIGAKLGAFFTNPVTAIVGGVIGAGLLAKSLIGRGRRAANDFGDEIERPFNSQLTSLLAQFHAQRDAGTLTIATATAFREDTAALIRQYNAAAADFAAQGSAQRKVAEQAEAGKFANFGEGFSRIFAELNAALAGVKGGATGAGIPETGRSFAASQVIENAAGLFSKAVDRFAENGGGGNTYTLNVGDQNIHIHLDADAVADPEAFIDRLRQAVRDNAEGIRAEWATLLANTLRGVTVSTS